MMRFGKKSRFGGMLILIFVSIFTLQILINLTYTKGAEQRMEKTLGETTYAFEAESSANTLTGNASISPCENCSGNQKVGDLWGGSSLRFNDVQVPKAGAYIMTIHYISGDPRSLTVHANDDSAATYSLPQTNDWDTLGKFDIEIALNSGENTLTFDDNGGWAPDIDKIELTYRADDDSEHDGDIGDIGALIKSSTFGDIRADEHENGFSLSTDLYTITYNLYTGLAAYTWNDQTIVTGVYSSIELDEFITNTEYTERTFSLDLVETIKDGHGKGIKVTIVNESEHLPTMKQIYQLYEQQPYFIMSQEVHSEALLSTNFMAPLVMNSKGGVDLGSYHDNHVLIVPFDNDMWSRYEAKTMNTNLNTDLYVSSELTAIYDNASRHGLIIGSVTHDTWKTGISWSGSNDRLNKLNVFGGFTSWASTMIHCLMVT